ncbi:MAG: hypothetical protein HY436_01565 [Candidatus Liptonbacteria bacterium]|nr:hypothetical protein [Candidatus Liptonbacteria bacterium]
MNPAERAYGEAVAVLRSCVRPAGFYASGLKGGYEAVWARDSMITSLGGAAAGREFKRPFGQSLSLLMKHQSTRGQIPNAVGSYNTDRKSDVTFNSIDSTLWYLVGMRAYGAAYGERAFARRYKKSVDAAFTWLSYQDPNEDGLPVQQPTMDWQDAFPHKYGRTINTLALYFAALRMYGKSALARRVQRVVNGAQEQYLSLYDKKRGYYLPWIWKNHVSSREEEYWFDTLGNVLAIVTGLATPAIAKRILSYIDKEKINRPYPCKAIFPPIKKGDKEWKNYFADSDARTPYEYLNGGIWPMVGGFYVAALVKTRQFKKAERELLRLAEGNKQVNKELAPRSLGARGWGFQEWLHGKSGKAFGNSNPYQAWSAGAYLFAYECVRRKRVPFFT